MTHPAVLIITGLPSCSEAVCKTASWLGDEESRCNRSLSSALPALLQHCGHLFPVCAAPHFVSLWTLTAACFQQGGLYWSIAVGMCDIRQYDSGDDANKWTAHYQSVRVVSELRGEKGMVPLLQCKKQSIISLQLNFWASCWFWFCCTCITICLYRNEMWRIIVSPVRNVLAQSRNVLSLVYECDYTVCYISKWWVFYFTGDAYKCLTSLLWSLFLLDCRCQVIRQKHYEVPFIVLCFKKNWSLMLTLFLTSCLLHAI